MRKVVLALLFLIAGLSQLYAQSDGSYKLTLTFSRIKNTGNDMQSTEYRVSTVSAAGTEQLHAWSSGSVDENRYVSPPPPIVRYINASENKLPQKLQFWGKRTWSILFGSKSREGTNELTLGPLPAYFSRTTSRGDNGELLFPSLETSLTIEIIPVSIKLHYYTEEGQGQESTLRVLPDNDVITLKATKGFVPTTYRWQYQVAGESSWRDVPASAKYSEGNAVVTFKGTDLFSQEAFNRLVQERKNVLFRINAITDEHRNEADYEKIVLTPTYSLPRILSHTVEQESCHQSGDATIRVTLNRSLHPGEALALFQQGGAGRNIESLDATNSFLIPNLSAGSYSFYIKGTHSNGLSGYSNQTSHQFTAQVVERPAISYSLSHRDVSCLAGQDGTVTVTASGGTGNYSASLYKEDGTLLETKNFSGGGTTFGRLPAGSYSVRIKDSNDCLARTTSGDEQIQRVTLSEPSEAVAIELLKTVRPLAHNSADGIFEIAVSGGTPSASGYNVRFVRKEHNQPFSPTFLRQDGNKYIYTLSGIGRGEYTAIAEDHRYSSLQESDKKPPCGCKAELDLQLTAPPPLLVTLQETHYVSCHGDRDGELTAHASGGKPSTSSRLPYAYSWYRLQGGVKTLLPLQADSIARGLEAGHYWVKITDANGISLESPSFELIQPEALSLSFQTTAPSCSDAEGQVVAVVRGGTPPYSYEWNKEGASNATLTIQESGSYFVRVKDSRGCSITGNTEVTAPNALTIKPTITHPTCHGASNGTISLSLSGGTAPYSITWEDGANTSFTREGLKAGVYIARIQDQSGCTLHYRVVLNEPEPIVLTLDEGFTLCKDQSRWLSVRASVTDLSYQWRRNGQVLGETRASLLVDAPGQYEVIATSSEGCSAKASVEIKASNLDLPLDITAPSTVSAGEPIHVVNISRVKADRLEWQLPKEAQVQQRSDERVVFTLPRVGVYEVKLLGYLGDCTTLVSQRVEVLAQGNLLPNDESPISQFLITPNPTTGAFQVLVELKAASDFTLRLLSPTAVEMDRKELKQTRRQTFDYELRGDTEGIFGVELTVGKVKALLKVTKKRK